MARKRTGKPRKGFSLPFRITPIGKLFIVVALIAGLAVVAASCKLFNGLFGGGQDARIKDRTSLTVAIPPGSKAPQIRVLLRALSAQDSLTVSALKDGKAAEVMARFDESSAPVASMEPLTLTGGSSVSVDLKTRALNASRASLSPPSGGYLVVNNNLYRGSLNVVAKRNGSWEVISVVTLEDYTLGALGWEMPAGWPVEALKAQAVAIRTYTLYHVFDDLRSGRKREWDVDDTTGYLRYGGAGPWGKPNESRETPNALRAVKDTSGEVMLYRGDIFKAYFHACSGGQTTNSTSAFAQETIEPLSGVDLGSHGKECSLYRWSRNVRLAEIASRLPAKTQREIGTLSGIEPVKDERGWMFEVNLKGDNGSATVSAREFRAAIGTGRDGLPSNAFDLTLLGEDAVFMGRGWGHGVGLDQWAAFSMAREGSSYSAILKRMYPGTELARPW